VARRAARAAVRAELRHEGGARRAEVGEGGARTAGGAHRKNHAMPCHAMPCHAMPCHPMPCHAMPCHAMP
jgi:hypothetical protein